MWPSVKEEFEKEWASILSQFGPILGPDPTRFKLLVFDAYAQGRVDQACEDARVKGGKR